VADHEPGSRFAMSHAEAEIRRRGAIPDEIEDTGAKGDLARRKSGVSPTRSTSSNTPRPASISAATTMLRRSSPMTLTPSAYTMNSYTPSTVPGLPHAAFRARGRQFALRCVGPEFTLLRLDPAAEIAPLELAARARVCR